jgi:hypothetical protein
VKGNPKSHGRGRKEGTVRQNEQPLAAETLEKKGGHHPAMNDDDKSRHEHDDSSAHVPPFPLEKKETPQKQGKDFRCSKRGVFSLNRVFVLCEEGLSPCIQCLSSSFT